MSKGPIVINTNAGDDNDEDNTHQTSSNNSGIKDPGVPVNPNPTMQDLSEHNVTALMDKPNEMTNLNPTPQCSHQQTTLTAQGTTMKGLPHMSRTEHTVNER